MTYTPTYTDPRAKYVDGVHPATLEPEVLLPLCEIQTGRVSGPGGQHRNKTDSAVWIRHVATDLETQATERRSQHENRRVALWRIRVKLAIRCRTAVDRDRHKASALWCRRRQGSKLPVSATHQDYPALLAEALDVVTARRFDIAGAAAVLGVTMSQLSRLIRHEKHAFAMLNDGREATGLPRLRS
ncbi:MAG: peptide chain release factor-like protein [Planctomycetota bacterium]|nr:peptide chain release factor-like protein [Planctomycetota bacterium]MDA1105500.1 peptide chain release factor-like protein [Planctomycetota bacterium]